MDLAQLGGAVERETRARGRDLALLALAWAVAMAGCYLVLGVRLGGDSGRYLEGAKALLAGQALAGKQLHFLGYQALVALGLRAGGGPAGVVAIQCLLSLLAAWCLWRAGTRIFSPLAGWLAALLYLAYPDVQAWNFYVLTDGPFASLLAISLSLGLLAGRGEIWCWLALVPALAGLALLRPEGVLFFLPLAIYLAARDRWGAALLIFLAGAALFVGLGGRDAAAQEDLLGHWQRGTVIWGAAMDWPSPRLAAGAAGGLAAFLWQALTRDPLWLLDLLARRWFWFLAHLRPYYSLAHNLLAGAASLLWLVLGLGAVLRAGRGREKALLWLTVLAQMALVGLTWADHDGRFLTRVTPALILLAAAGLAPGRPRGEYLSG